MDRILIENLTVSFRVGVSESERSRVQKLLISVEIEHDFTNAAATDDINKTIDYFKVTQRVLRFGQGKSWKLIETLAVELAQSILSEFQAQRVKVDVKKFIIPEAQYVAVSAVRSKPTL